MLRYDATSGKSELVFKVELNPFIPETNWLIGPPANAKWELPEPLSIPASDKTMAWQVFEKNGRIHLFVRTHQLGVHDRPRFHLYRLDPDGTVPAPSEIVVPLPAGKEHAEYRHNLELTPYLADDYLALTDGHRAWKIAW